MVHGSWPLFASWPKEGPGPTRQRRGARGGPWVQNPLTLNPWDLLLRGCIFMDLRVACHGRGSGDGFPLTIQIDEKHGCLMVLYILVCVFFVIISLLVCSCLLLTCFSCWFLGGTSGSRVLRLLDSGQGLIHMFGARKPNPTHV